ncbi:MAG: hypothetical protein QF386_05315 [Alphaproteobacteria bacterium]|nr:hypothetical protein [Alphaproteobacteria bacterium]
MTVQRRTGEGLEDVVYDVSFAPVCSPSFQKNNHQHRHGGNRRHRHEKTGKGT